MLLFLPTQKSFLTHFLCCLLQQNSSKLLPISNSLCPISLQNPSQSGFRSGARRPSPSRQAGSRAAGSQGLVSIGGGRPSSLLPGAEDPHRLLLTCGSMSSSVPHLPGWGDVQWMRTGSGDSLDPRSLARPRHSTRARGSRGHQHDATPATFEFQRLPPHSPRSALRDQ